MIGHDPWDGASPRAAAAQSPGARRLRTASTAGQALIAPMPASVLAVDVKPGDTVRKGDVVIVLEAMKMELPIRALGDGIVSAVRCRAGDLVQADAVLVEFS